MGVRAVETITASVIFTPLVGRDIGCHILNTLTPRIAHQMVSRITELDVDGGDPFEVMADVQFVAHAHAPVKLDSLLSDETRGIADLRFRAGRQFRSVRLVRYEAQIQMLSERDRLFESDEHIDHA